MNQKKDHPGVYPPPPLFYAVIFFLSILLQKNIPFPDIFFKSSAAQYLAITMIGMGIVCSLPAIITFLKTKNTLVTILPATSLQTKGIYNITRNPMYLGLLFVYTGIAFLKGNWWTFILIPLLIFIITHFVIKKEENYLSRAFDPEYAAYKKRVRRWI